MQLSYSDTMKAGFPGMKADTGFDYVESMSAREKIYPGLALVKVIGEDKQVRLPITAQVIITDDGGTYTAGNYKVTINGYLVNVAYDTDKDTTLGNVATALQALGFVLSAAYSSSAHTITIVAKSNVNITGLSVDISGITGNMTIDSIVEYCTDTVHGTSLIAQHMEQGYGFPINDKGTITLTGDAMAANDTITAVINGVTVGPITYDTSEDKTLNLLAHQIETLNGVDSTDVSGRIITILMNEGLEIKINSVTVVDDSGGTCAASYAVEPQNPGDAGLVFYKASDTVNVLRRGRIYVTAEQAVTSDDPVYFRHVASGTYKRGGFRKDSDSGKATLLSGAKWAKSAGAGDVGVVEINFP